MKAPLSSNSRTGARVFSVRERMNPLAVVNRGRSHEVKRGRERQRGGEVAVALDAYRDAQEELPLGVRQPSERVESG